MPKTTQIHQDYNFLHFLLLFDTFWIFQIKRVKNQVMTLRIDRMLIYIYSRMLICFLSDG
jgi:hypothetical protein